MNRIEPPAEPGILGSLRALGEGLLGGIRDRVALASLELEEEKHRLIRIFFWFTAVVFTGVMAIAFASIALVYFFWESARLAVLCGLALAYTGAFAAICVAFRRYLAAQPRSFESTLRELDRDRACFRNDS